MRDLTVHPVSRREKRGEKEKSFNGDSKTIFTCHVPLKEEEDIEANHETRRKASFNHRMPPHVPHEWRVWTEHC